MLCCLITFALTYLLPSIVIGGFVLLLILIITTEPYPKIHVYKSETVFVDPNDDAGHGSFGSLEDKESVDLSVIVPAYNEQDRLPFMMEETTKFLESRVRESRQEFSYEVIIVDDGSKDATSKVALKYSKELGTNKCRVLTLAKNLGKGGAVRRGMLVARGRNLLFADADGATRFDDLVLLENKLEEICSNSLALVCGSRAHLETESIARRSLFRTFLMYGFHTCVRTFGCVSVRDTQCGFKLITRDAARILFRSLHIERWAFDVELIKIAEMRNIPIGEIAVHWNEIEGSKLSPLIASLQMFIDLIFLWLKYAVGAWKLVEKAD